MIPNVALYLVKISPSTHLEGLGRSGRVREYLFRRVVTGKMAGECNRMLAEDLEMDQRARL